MRGRGWRKNPNIDHGRTSMRARSITMLILGILFSMLGIGLLFGGIGASWVNSLQNDGGYLTSPSERFDVNSSAIISAGPDNMRDDAYPGPLPFDVGSIRISAASANADKEIFVGIAPRSDVERYLSGANYSELLDVSFRPFHVEYRETQGAQQPPLPSGQDFWATSASGSGEQELDWNIEPGNWSVVIMNADASPDIRADLQAGFRSELFGPIAAGLLAAGAILLVIGVPLLIFGAQGLGRHATAAATPGAAVPAPMAFAVPAAVPPLSNPAAETAPYPARLWGGARPGVVQVAVAREVVPGHTALHRAVFSLVCVRCGHGNCRIRNPLYRPISPLTLRFQRRSPSLELASGFLWLLSAWNRQVPAVYIGQDGLPC